MRVYLGIKGSEDMIMGSVEVEDVFKKLDDLSREDFICWMYANINKNCQPLKRQTIFHNKQNDLLHWQGWNIGWKQQGYAIEITDFVAEESYMDLPGLFSKIQAWNDETEIYDSAILLPIFQEHFDMIASGKKKYLFINRLPKVLREVTNDYHQ